MTLRWFATGPIYFNRVRSFNAGDWVPDSVVTSQGLTAQGLVVQVDVPGQDPAAATRPLTTSDRDTDAEREDFIPARLSAAALREAYVTAVTDSTGGVTLYQNGVEL